jgi:hypothetical protein
LDDLTTEPPTVVGVASEIPTISRAALRNEVGELSLISLVGHPTRFSPPRTIPCHDDLDFGDVILSRRKRPNWFARQISKVQLNCNCKEDFTSWTHAMLYVGNLHVIESSKHFSIRSGVQITPLTFYSDTHDLLVLRYRNPEFLVRNIHIVRDALLYQQIGRRSYDFTVPYYLWRGKVRPKEKDFDRHINCSEFVLERFATGGPFLVEEWLKVRESANIYFFPADFAAHPGFDIQKIRYFRFVE